MCRRKPTCARTRRRARCAGRRRQDVRRAHRDGSVRAANPAFTAGRPLALCGSKPEKYIVPRNQLPLALDKTGTRGERRSTANLSVSLVACTASCGVLSGRKGSSDTCDQVLCTVAGICTPAPVGCDGFGTPLWQGGTSRHSGRRRVGGPGQADRHRRRVSEGDSPNFSRYCTENRPRWRNPHLVAASDTVVVDGSASRSHVRTAFIRTSRRYPIGVVP